MRHRAIKTICNKISSNKGESLAETMVSALIAALAMTMLAGALVTAARINKTASDISPYTDVTDKKKGSINISYSISGVEASSNKINVTIYGKPDMESGNVYFYEVSQDESTEGQNP